MEASAAELSKGRSGEFTYAGARLRHVEGSGDIYAFGFPMLSGGDTKFAATPPLAGWLWLDWVQLVTSIYSLQTNFHDVQLGMGSELPANQAEMDKAEFVFPYARGLFGWDNRIEVYGPYQDQVIPVGRALRLGGRRIVCAFRNGSPTRVAFAVRVGVHGLTEVLGAAEFPVQLGGVLGELQGAAELSGSGKR